MTKRAEIKKDLLEQLEEKGIYGNMYTDMVNDYMDLWDIKNLLIKDVKQRGVSIEWKNGEKQGGFKRNDSIAELNRTNMQMLKILNDLGLKATAKEVVDKDDGIEEM